MAVIESGEIHLRPSRAGEAMMHAAADVSNDILQSVPSFTEQQTKTSLNDLAPRFEHIQDLIDDLQDALDELIIEIR